MEEDNYSFNLPVVVESKKLNVFNFTFLRSLRLREFIELLSLFSFSIDNDSFSFTITLFTVGVVTFVVAAAAHYLKWPCKPILSESTLTEKYSAISLKIPENLSSNIEILNSELLPTTPEIICNNAGILFQIYTFIAEIIVPFVGTFIAASIIATQESLCFLFPIFVVIACEFAIFIPVLSVVTSFFRIPILLRSKVPLLSIFKHEFGFWLIFPFAVANGWLAMSYAITVDQGGRASILFDLFFREHYSTIGYVAWKFIMIWTGSIPFLSAYTPKINATYFPMSYESKVPWFSIWICNMSFLIWVCFTAYYEEG
jgi:hypothetical protein